MIDFDNIDGWESSLADALHPHLSLSVRPTIAAAAPEYVEDALDLLFNLSERNEVIDATLKWIRSTYIVAYHGSRLTDVDVISIQENGLIPLKAEARRHRLIRSLSSHADWQKVAGQLDAAIKAHGQGWRAGRRENQVHLTLSKAGLTSSFNHYLTHGSEFDQHVAWKLLGPTGMELLKRDGDPKVIRVAIPGIIALDAAHPFFDIETIRSRGGIPNLVNEFLKAWSYRLAHPGFQSRSLNVDIGMMFRSIVPAEWILSFDPW